MLRLVKSIDTSAFEAPAPVDEQELTVVPTKSRRKNHVSRVSERINIGLLFLVSLFGGGVITQNMTNSTFIAFCSTFLAQDVFNRIYCVLITV